MQSCCLYIALFAYPVLQVTVVPSARISGICFLLAFSKADVSQSQVVQNQWHMIITLMLEATIALSF
jgi:hypothetical protein